jgi:multidrug transporter EmrE-like cation transporter
MFIVIAALMTAASNLMLRAGITRAGGFAISLASLGQDLVDIARQPLVVVGVIFYGLAALVWFRVVSTENLNTSYPVLVGLTFTLVTIGATLIFKEPISVLKAFGLGLIFIGIVVVSRL